MLPRGPVDLYAIPERTDLAPAELRAVSVGDGTLVELAFRPARSLVVELVGQGELPVGRADRTWLVEERLCEELGMRSGHLVHPVLVGYDRWASRVNAHGQAGFTGLAPGRYRLLHTEAGVRFDPPVVEVPAEGDVVRVRWMREEG